MASPKVTVAIPTFDRADYLGEAIESVLDQTYLDFELLVVDNASTDATEPVVRSFQDSRIRYARNATNIEMIANWNTALQLCRAQYVMILGDDDKLLPAFLERSVAVLDRDERVAFTYSHCNKVDAHGRFIRLWGYELPPAGFMSGRDYLAMTAKYGCCMTNSSTVLMRRSALDSVGPFRAEFGSNTFDFNMWIRIASSHDVYFIDEVLVDYRLHPDQVSELHWRTASSPTGALGTVPEIIEGIAVLLANPAARDDEYRAFLVDRLRYLNARGVELTRKFVPQL